MAAEKLGVVLENPETLIRQARAGSASLMELEAVIFKGETECQVYLDSTLISQLINLVLLKLR